MANHKYQTSNELNAGATKRNSAHMLPVSDWLSDLPENTQLTNLIEVQFKNTRKGYFHNLVIEHILWDSTFEQLR